MKTQILAWILLFFSLQVFAAKVDTANTYSQSMKKNIKATVVIPTNSDAKVRFPVIYLLHGFGGNYKDWITKAPGIKDLADRYQTIIVCPDGNFASWYFDSPKMSDVRYETYVATELVKFVDDKYNTIADKQHRAITGLSMGGHGALYLAFRHQDVFGAAGAMSGGVDLRPFPGNWGIANLLGTYAESPENWENNTVINQTHLLSPNSLSLIIQCGSEDFFYKVNEKLHEKLAYNNIPHTFISSPGGHTWEYWADAVPYHVMFFNNFFNKKK